MPLADDIRKLEHQALADLTAVHDYYTDTKAVWDIVEGYIAKGEILLIENPVTGTRTTHIELAAKAEGYVTGYLAEATFQQFLSIFENFFLDFLSRLLLAYPQRIRAKQVDLAVVLDAPDKDAVTEYVIRKELNELTYKKPADWFAYLENWMKLGCPTEDEIARIAEAKASRDVLAHNRGIANKTYGSKAGKLARYRDGQRIEVSEQYHRETWKLLGKVITDISAVASTKAS